MFKIFEISDIVLTGMVSFWVGLMIADMLHTLKYKEFLGHEQYFIFVFFMKRTNLRNSAILTLIIDGLIVFSLSFMVTYKFELELFAIAGIVIGFIHLDGIIKTRKFVKNKILKSS